MPFNPPSALPRSMDVTEIEPHGSILPPAPTAISSRDTQTIVRVWTGRTQLAPTVSADGEKVRNTRSTSLSFGTRVTAMFKTTAYLSRLSGKS